MTSDDIQMVPIDDLNFEKKADSLSAELIDRITLIYHTFRPYLNASLEQTIDNFKYDTNPDKEIALWERMGQTVLTLKYQDNWPDEKITKGVKVVLGLSMGQIEGNELGDEDTQRIVAIWSNRQPR